MSFRFNLGDVVVPRNQKLAEKVPVKIEAFHLNGFMKVRAISTNMWYLVKDEDFELFAETKPV
jgi:hypothetical protein|tara:strand:+ start:762 stop:950 length:189 start_codon:yes stop_codon:yes gene_type:complete